MNESQIRRIVQQETARQSQADRFNLTNTSRHQHTGNDIAAVIFQPSLTYYGIILSTGSVILLPRGWTCSYLGAPGEYQIFHNLNTLGYTVIASALQSTNAYVSPVITPDTNNFVITWGGGALGDMSFGRFDTKFNFALTVVNNNSQQIPTYSGTLVP